jgi:hypothetical protein
MASQMDVLSHSGWEGFANSEFIGFPPLHGQTVSLGKTSSAHILALEIA